MRPAFRLRRPLMLAALAALLPSAVSAAPTPQATQTPQDFLPLTVEVRPLQARPAALQPLIQPLPAPPEPIQPLAPILPLPSEAGPLTPVLALPQGDTAPKPRYVPAAGLAPQQTYLDDIGLTRAWAEQGQLSAGVTVAVLDTGYTPHPQLGGRLINGYDFVSDAARAGDGNGRDGDASAVGPYAFHGEMIAGIIAAGHGSGAGRMAGINPAARVVTVRVADTSGMVRAADLADGLRWAAGLNVPGAPRNPNPARILNVSLYADWLPDTGCDPRIASAVRDVTRAGALVVVGAGNEDRDAGRLSPAGCTEALTVTGVYGGQRASYANWGRAVALAAPSGLPEAGLKASTALDAAGRAAPLSVQERNGTSFAAPQVSAAASLLLGQRPNLTPGELRRLLTETATPWPAGRCDPDPRKSCGAGVLNVAAALGALKGSPNSR